LLIKLSFSGNQNLLCWLCNILNFILFQMMVEGPGHVLFDGIEGNIMLEKCMSGGAPYYVLGPLPTTQGLVTTIGLL